MLPKKASFRGRDRRPQTARPAARKRMSGTPAAKVVVDRLGPLHAEIVVVGRELLRGQLRDGNASWIAGELTRRGALVHRVTIVDDLERSIMNAVGEARERGVHLIVTTGGLGPAQDDRTLAGLAEALRLPLVISPPARDMVEAAYRVLKDTRVVGTAGLNASRQKMCLLPVGAEAIPNPAGVAPGMILRLTGGAAVVSVPGRPEESKAVFEAALLRLRDLFPCAPRRSASSKPDLGRIGHAPGPRPADGGVPRRLGEVHPPAARRKDPIRVTLQFLRRDPERGRHARRGSAAPPPRLGGSR